MLPCSSNSTEGACLGNTKTLQWDLYRYCSLPCFASHPPPGLRGPSGQGKKWLFWPRYDDFNFKSLRNETYMTFTSLIPGQLEIWYWVSYKFTLPQKVPSRTWSTWFLTSWANFKPSSKLPTNSTMRTSTFVIMNSQPPWPNMKNTWRTGTIVSKQWSTPMAFWLMQRLSWPRLSRPVISLLSFLRMAEP